MPKTVAASVSALFFGLSLSLHAEDAAKPLAPSTDEKDLCSYLKDVEAKTDADCDHEVFATLKSKDSAAYSQMVGLAQKRKTDVLKAHEFLTAQPSREPGGNRDTVSGENPNARHDQHMPTGTGPQNRPSPTQLQPPINARTFPAWIGTDAKDLKDVYTRWLQAQNQELQQEKEQPVTPERSKEIEAALTANKAKITALGKIKDPAELSCFLGESCGARSSLFDPATDAAAAVKGPLTKADYERLNATPSGPNLRLDGGAGPPLGSVSDEIKLIPTKAKQAWWATRHYFADKVDTQKTVNDLGIANTEEGRRVLEKTPGFGKSGKVQLAYIPMDSTYNALTGGSKGASSVPIAMNTAVRGSPDEKYILQHELHHAGAKVKDSYGQMPMEYAAHLSAIRSFVEEHPEFTKGFDALKIPKKDKYIAQDYFYARVWADHLTETEKDLHSNPLKKECADLMKEGVIGRDASLCKRLKKVIYGDPQNNHPPCHEKQMCGGYDGLFYVIDRAYEESGENNDMDSKTNAFLHEELNEDLRFRKARGYSLKEPAQ